MTLYRFRVITNMNGSWYIQAKMFETVKEAENYIRKNSAIMGKNEKAYVAREYFDED